jgi:WD40 repeat protein
MSDAASPSWDLFVSYAEADRGWVEGYLLDGLRAAGVRCLTQADFGLGAHWTVEFERAAAQSQRVLLVLSRASLADVNQRFLDGLARYHELKTDATSVIPLLLDDVELPLGLEAKVSLWATTTEEREQAVERLADACRAGPPTDGAALPCPYPGMAPFDRRNADLFHGRRREVEELLQELRHRRCLFLIGRSGSGKSSLVLAGLLPRLEKGRTVHVMRPGATPAATLAALPCNPGEACLLVVDQFEEVYTRAQTDEARRFQEALCAWVERPERVLLVTVRADFYPDLQNSDAIFPLFRANHRDVLPLGREALREAIVEPAAGAGVFVEPALVERLLADAAGEPCVLPHLQETMQLLWERRRRRYLPLEAYQELGRQVRTGLQQAMAVVADAAVDDLKPEEQALARRTLLRLVQFGEGREDSRRQQPLSALESAGDPPGMFERVLARLILRRLVVPDVVRAGTVDTTVIDLAHEALITGWPRLQSWVRESREAEQTRRRLEGAAAEWVRLGRGEGGLLDEVELHEATEWLRNPASETLGTSQDLVTLMEASRKAIRMREEAEEAVRRQTVEQARLLAREQQRSNRRLRRGVALSLSLAVVALGLAALAWGYWKQALDSADHLRRESEKARQAEVEARNQRDLAEARRLAALAATEWPEHPDTALLLACESHQRMPTSEVRDLLWTHLNGGPTPKGFLSGHESPVRAIAFRPDGTSLATADETTIQLWDLTQDPPLRKNRFAHGHTKGVNVIAFSPDGKRLASAGQSPFRGPKEPGWAKEHTELRLWDCETGRQMRIFSDGNKLSPVLSMAFSPDGKHLAWGGGARHQFIGAVGLGELRLWDLTTDRHTQIIAPESAIPPVRSVAFGSGGVIAAFDGKDVNLWEVTGGKPIKKAVLEGSEGPLAFSPNGTVLASWGKDRDRPKLVLWDLSGKKPKRTTAGNWGVLPPRRQLAFSPDGTTLATADLVGLTLWDVSGPAPAPIRHPFATDEIPEDLIVGDTRVKRGIFGLPTPLFPRLTEDQYRPPFSLDGEGRDFTIRLGMSPKGTALLASTRRFRPTSAPLGNRDHTVILWEPGTPTLGKTLLPMEKGAKSLIAALSPTGKLAVVRTDKAVVLWDLSQSKPIDQGTLEAPLGAVWFWVWAFSLDGTKLAAAGKTDIVVWDVSHDPAVLKKRFLHGHAVNVSALTFSHDGKRLASGGGEFDRTDPVRGELVLWDWETGRQTHVLPKGNKEPVGSVAFSPDGGVLAAGLYTGRADSQGSFNAAVFVWDLDEIQVGRRSLLGRHLYEVQSVAFSPDGKTLAAGGGYVWRSRAQVVGPSGELSLWSVAGSEYTKVHYQRTGIITHVVFSGDSTTLACVEEKAISLWDVPSRRKYESRLRGCDGPLTFHPGGKALMTCGIGSTVILWNLDAAFWAKRAGAVVNRNFSRGEWARFFPEVPYRRTFPQLPPGDGVTP